MRISENLVFRQLIDELGQGDRLESVVDNRHCQKQTHQHNFLVIEGILGNVRVKVEDASFQLLCWDSLSCQSDYCRNALGVLVEALL